MSAEIPIGITGIPPLPRPAFPKHIVIIHHLVTAIDEFDAAKRFYNRAVDTGLERKAEAQWNRAQRKYERALKAARDFKAEEGF